MRAPLCQKPIALVIVLPFLKPIWLILHPHSALGQRVCGKGQGDIRPHTKFFLEHIYFPLSLIYGLYFT